MASKSKAIFLVITSVLFALFAWVFYGNATISELPTNKNWGSKTNDPIARAGGPAKPFELNVKPEVINDLQQVLGRNVNMQPPLDGAGFQYGFNSKCMKSLVNYWRDEYLPKWTTRQEYINQLKQYHVEINGLSIHYIHEKPKGGPPSPDQVRVPILLLHGWPGSVREFYDLIPKLTSFSKNHVYTFEVVAPSLVGYGFSEATNKQGFCTYEMAIVMRNLMTHLGYDRFIVHGGDWGSIIGSQLTTLFPENVIGYHSNFCLVRTPRSMIKLWLASMVPGLFINSEEYHHHFPLSEKLKSMIVESGYFHLQATKPDTIGIALATSPIGLAAYILEKFSTGTNSTFVDLEDGGLFNHPIKMDALLDNIMFYYLSNSITSSVRFYAESSSTKQSSLPIDSVVSQVPMACIRFKNDIPSALNWQLKDKFPNLIQSTYVQQGGHFAAMELPDVMYKDIIEFVQKLASKSMLLLKKSEINKS